MEYFEELEAVVHADTVVPPKLSEGVNHPSHATMSPQQRQK